MELKKCIPINQYLIFLLRLSTRRREYIGAKSNPFPMNPVKCQRQKVYVIFNIYFIYWYFNLFEGIKKYIECNKTER